MSKNPRTKITQRIVDSLKAVTKETWIMDSEVVGLGIRQRPGAAPVWCLRYKSRKTGQDRKDNIGKVGRVTLDSARDMARQRLGYIFTHGEAQDHKLEARLRETVSDLLERVAEDMRAKGKAATYVRDFINQCRTYVEPALGNSLVRDVTQSDIDRVLMKIRDKPYLHNRVRSNLSKLFNVAIRDRIRTDTPVFKADRMGEEPRQRVLDDAEVARLLAVLDARPGMESDAFRLLYLTGSRPKELRQSKWQDFFLPDDLQQSSVWTKPAQTVKQRRSHTVELHPLASAVLRRMKEERVEALRIKQGRALRGDDYLFPSRKGDDKHLTELQEHWERTAAAANLEDTRIYDLRKSFASRVLAAGGDAKLAMSLTGHTQVGVFMKHYAHTQKGQQGAALARVQWEPTAPKPTTAATSE